MGKSKHSHPRPSQEPSAHGADCWRALRGDLVDSVRQHPGWFNPGPRTGQFVEEYSCALPNLVSARVLVISYPTYTLRIIIEK